MDKRETCESCVNRPTCTLPEQFIVATNLRYKDPLEALVFISECFGEYEKVMGHPAEDQMYNYLIQYYIRKAAENLIG